MLNLDTSGKWEQNGKIKLKRPINNTQLEKLKFRSFSAKIRSDVASLSTPTMNVELCANFQYIGENNSLDALSVSERQLTDTDTPIQLIINNQCGNTIYEAANGNTNESNFVLKTFNVPLTSSFEDAVQDVITQSRYELCKLLGVFDKNNNESLYDYNTFYNTRSAKPGTEYTVDNTQITTSPNYYTTLCFNNVDTYYIYIKSDLTSGYYIIYNSDDGTISNSLRNGRAMSFNYNCPFEMYIDFDIYNADPNNAILTKYTPKYVDNNYTQTITYAAFTSSTIQLKPICMSTSFDQTEADTIIYHFGGSSLVPTDYFDQRKISNIKTNKLYFIKHGIPSLQTYDISEAVNNIYNHFLSKSDNLDKIFIYNVYINSYVNSYYIYVLCIDTQISNIDKIRLIGLQYNINISSFSAVNEFELSNDLNNLGGIIEEFHNYNNSNIVSYQQNIFKADTGYNAYGWLLIMLPYFKRLNGTYGRGILSIDCDGALSNVNGFIQNSGQARLSNNCKLDIKPNIHIGDNPALFTISEFIYGSSIQELRYSDNLTIEFDFSSFKDSSNATIKDLTPYNIQLPDNNFMIYPMDNTNELNKYFICYKYHNSVCDITTYNMHVDVFYNDIYTFANSNIKVKCGDDVYKAYIPTIDGTTYAWVNTNHTSQTTISRPYFYSDDSVYNFINNIFEINDDNTIRYPILALYSETSGGKYKLGNLLFYFKYSTTPSILTFDPNSRQSNYNADFYYTTIKQKTNSTPSLYWNDYNIDKYTFISNNDLYERMALYLDLNTTDQTLKLISPSLPTLNNIVFYLDETAQIDFKEADIPNNINEIELYIIDSQNNILTPDAAALLYSNITVCLDWAFA